MSPPVRYRPFLLFSLILWMLCSGGLLAHALSPRLESDAEDWEKCVANPFVLAFGLRLPLVTFGNIASMVVFGQSYDRRVLRGKDGWLFLQTTPAITQQHPFTEQEMEQWKHYLETRSAWFTAHGMRYAFFIAPDKQTIYPEYFPLRTFPSRRLQLEAYLKAHHAAVQFLDPTDALLSQKKNLPLYYDYDTHWNDDAALGAYRFLAEQLHLDISWLSQSNPLRREAGTQKFDLLKMLRLTHVLPSDRQRLMVQSPQASVLHTERDSCNNVREVLTSTKRPSLPSMVVYADSFFEVLQPYMSESANVLLWNHKYDPQRMEEADLQQVKPAVVLEEMVERKLASIDYLPSLEEWMKNPG